MIAKINDRTAQPDDGCKEINTQESLLDKRICIIRWIYILGHLRAACSDHRICCLQQASNKDTCFFWDWWL